MKPLLVSMIVASFVLPACEQHGHQGNSGDATTDAGAAGPASAPRGAAESAADDPVMAQVHAFIAEQSPDTSLAGWKTRLNAPPTATFDPDAVYYWDLVTSEGPLTIRLMPDVAPAHVTSTIYLTELGFYDDLVFHRIIPGFMAQGGDPLGTGRGGPGYKFAGEIDRSVTHDRPGLLSMANAGPGTDGSQFFLTFAPTPHLDGKHTIFGEIVEGMDTLQALEQRGSPSNSGATIGKVTLDSATIRVERHDVE